MVWRKDRNLLAQIPVARKISEGIRFAAAVLFYHSRP
jgi:hypothetical protein